MDHIAIMNPGWKLIPKILSEEKKIESRWYKTKRTPWDKISKGDTIYFKDAGKAVTAKADVEKVLQFTLSSLEDIQKIIQDYGKEIALVNNDPSSWKSIPNYCILLFLKNPTAVPPFSITKKGFGTGCAWITVENVTTIRLSQYGHTPLL